MTFQIHKDKNIEHAFVVLVSAINGKEIPRSYLNQNTILESIMSVHNLTKVQSKTVVSLCKKYLKVAQ